MFPFSIQVRGQVGPRGLTPQRPPACDLSKADPGGFFLNVTSPLGETTCVTSIDFSTRETTWPQDLEVVVAVQLNGASPNNCWARNITDFGEVAILVVIPALSGPMRHINNGVPARDLKRYPAHPGCARSFFGDCVGGILVQQQSLLIQAWSPGYCFRTSAAGQWWWANRQIVVDVHGTVSKDDTSPTHNLEQITTKVLQV